jgi:hypothetical protein
MKKPTKGEQTRSEILEKANIFYNEQGPEPQRFEQYFFQYACMTSNWIISFNLFDSHKTLENVKTRYIRSILCCLKPNLTDEGRENMGTAFLELEQIPALD